MNLSAVLIYNKYVREWICEGEIALIGPSVISLKGGMGGTYVKTTGAEGCGTLILRTAQAEEVRIGFEVSGENVSTG